MATEISPYDQTMCTVAAALTTASLGSNGATATLTVQRYREIMSELANGGGIQRGAPAVPQVRR